MIQEDIARAPKYIKDTPYGIHMYMRSLYHRLFISGTGEYAKEQEVMDLVLLNDTEDLKQLSYLSSLIRGFRTSMLAERFGLSIKEWLDMPKYLADVIREDSSMESAQEAERIKQAERDQKKEEEKYK